MLSNIRRTTDFDRGVCLHGRVTVKTELGRNDLKKLLLVGVLFLLSACTDPYSETTRKLVMLINHQGQTYSVYETTKETWDPTHGPDKPASGTPPLYTQVDYVVVIDGEEHSCSSADDCQRVVAEKTASSQKRSATTPPVIEGEGGDGGGGHSSY
jgi:hypothetical protein